MPEKDSTSTWISNSQSTGPMGLPNNSQTNLQMQVSVIVLLGEMLTIA